MPVLDNATLGLRLRLARERLRLSLDQLADTSGLSKPYLSRLESGDRQPSLGALMDLSRVLGVRVGALLGEEDEGAGIAVHGPDAPRRETGGLSIASASGYIDSSALEALRVTVAADRVPSAPASHAGEEWLYVLSGTLLLEYSEELYELTTGMSAHFDARGPHRLNAHRGHAEALLVWTNEVPDAHGIHR